MNITAPQIPRELTPVNNFYTYAHEFLSEELPILEVQCGENSLNEEDFFKMEVQRSVFHKCAFCGCCMENASFVDVVFQACDFSNSKLRNSYFQRCTFVSCKCIGMDMSDTVVKQTTFKDCNLQYSYFNKTQMTNVLFDHIDFIEASMSEAKLKDFEATRSHFVKNNFFKTLLASVDFRGNELAAPMVSSPPVELRGAIIDMAQAADLISLFGLVVE